jgi:hypothetical protein
MNSDVSLNQPTDPVRRAVVTLPPKRRSKFVHQTEPIAPLPIPAVSPFARQSRMKRSGQMSLYWRTESSERNTVRISPEILSAFHEAIGALGKSTAKQPAQAAA